MVFFPSLTDPIRKALFALSGRLRPSRLRRPVFDAVPAPGAAKRALFVYSALPFHLPESHPAFRYHQNLRQARQIAGVLAEFGYTVDVVDHSDRTFRPMRVYDLLLCHRVDHAGLEPAIGPETVKIYLSSGTNHVIHNARLRERVRYLEARKPGLRFEQVMWDSEDMPYLKIADAVIGFGNDAVMDSWQSVVSGPRYGFPNYGFQAIANPQRDWASARQNFLFLGSWRQVGKGLDLLLDSFASTPALHLHVCSKYKHEPDFCRAYDAELFRTPNIHACGWIDIGGKRFRELAARCAWVILPSCSEGSPGSVTNAMFAGLIPVVTREAGIDTDGFGFTLENDRVETIRQTVTELSRLPPEEVATRSRATRHAAEERFSEAAFLRRWRTIMAEVTTTLRKP